MYGVASYYFGRTITEFPFLIIFPTIFALITYWMIGFNTFDHTKFAIYCISYLNFYTYLILIQILN